MTNRKLRLDVWRQSPDVTVIATQGEINSRFLEITLLDGSSYFNLTGCTAMIYLTKPDGKIVFNSCQIVNAANGLIKVGLTSQMSIVAGFVNECEIHIIGSDKSRLKIKGFCIDIQQASNIDDAIESTNEFTALVDALKKADESLTFVTQFLQEKEIEINGIVSAKMQNVDTQMTAINNNATTTITKVQTDGSNAISTINNTFTGAMDNYNQQVTTAVNSANTATTNANDAAAYARNTAQNLAYDAIMEFGGQPNGIATLDQTGQLKQTPTPERIGAVPTSRTINNKALSNNITITTADIGTSAIFLAAHPIGSIYETTVSTNPGTLYGGTWVIWGSGRTPVGVNTADVDFNIVEKKGGKKTERHKFRIGYKIYYGAVTGDDANAVQAYKYSTGAYGDYKFEGSTNSKLNNAIQDGARTASVAQSSSTGDTDDTSILQPYITCYIWKRTT